MKRRAQAGGILLMLQAAGVAGLLLLGGCVALASTLNVPIKPTEATGLCPSDAELALLKTLQTAELVNPQKLTNGVNGYRFESGDGQQVYQLWVSENDSDIYSSVTINVYAPQDEVTPIAGFNVNLKPPVLYMSLKLPGEISGQAYVLGPKERAQLQEVLLHFNQALPGNTVFLNLLAQNLSDDTAAPDCLFLTSTREDPGS